MNKEQNDNTRVAEPIIEKRIKLTPEQLQMIQYRKLQEAAKKNQAYISDGYYKNLQNFYNNNVFGYGLQGTPTNFNPNTPEGQQAISSTFNYAKGNALDFLTDTFGVGMSSGIGNTVYSKFTKGVFRSPSRKGAEAMVVDNTPTTVGKITSIPVEEMTARNAIPNTVPSKYIGYVKDKRIKLPTYIQNKVKVLTEETFPKYIDKLDRAMEKSGFKRVNDPNVQYRAYTNGQVVIDDIAPGNVGLTFFRQPKMIDFNLQSVPEWIEQGFSLKNGGKL